MKEPEQHPSSADARSCQIGVYLFLFLLIQYLGICILFDGSFVSSNYVVLWKKSKHITTLEIKNTLVLLYVLDPLVVLSFNTYVDKDLWFIKIIAQ